MSPVPSVRSATTDVLSHPAYDAAMIPMPGPTEAVRNISDISYP
jgi:hypothetical protein